MSSYKPGDTIYFTASITSLGTPLDPSSLTLVVDDPTGQQTSLSVVRDGVGAYHGLYALPSNASPGLWWARWTATNPQGLTERPFGVDPLAF